jgi:hypothetical protein
MPALETVGQYLEEARRLLQDEHVPYRYPTDDLVDALNIGLMEARRLRADLSSLVYYVCGRMQLRDDEPTTDQRAGALLTKFAAQLLTIQS